MSVSCFLGYSITGNQSAKNLDVLVIEGASFFKDNTVEVTEGALHHKLKISMFCVLFQNYQHFFEKWYVHLEVNCPRYSKMNGIKVLVDQAVLSYGSKQSKYCFDQ